MGVFEIWLGPLLLGSTFNVFLLGFVLMEGRRYYRSKNNDRLPLKILVAYILLMETFTAAVFMTLVWHYCISAFGNPLELFHTPWVMTAVPLLAACSSLPVQLFYARRVVSLTHQLWFGIIIGAISFVIFGLAVTITVILSRGAMPPPTSTNYLVHILGSVAIALHIVNDIAIAASLVWYLHRNRTGIPRSDALIDDIVRLTIQTGSLTAIVVIILLILNSSFMTQTSNSTSAMVYMPLSKFYSLSLLVTLNARQGWSFGETNSRMWDTAPVAAQSPDLGDNSNNTHSHHLRSGRSRRRGVSTLSEESNHHDLTSRPHLATSASMHLSTFKTQKDSTLCPSTKSAGPADNPSLEDSRFLENVDPLSPEQSTTPRLETENVTASIPP